VDLSTIQQQVVAMPQAEVVLSASEPPKQPGTDVNMEAPPDLGTVVPFFDLEGVPIHWHAFIWLSVFACLSLATITGYCCLAYVPEKGVRRLGSKLLPSPSGSTLASPSKSFSQETPPGTEEARSHTSTLAASASSRASTTGTPETAEIDYAVDEARPTMWDNDATETTDQRMAFLDKTEQAPNST
jgi:hypothetical protein